MFDPGRGLWKVRRQRVSEAGLESTFSFLSVLKKIFIYYRGREKEHEQGEGLEGEKLKQSLCSVPSPM